MLGCCPKITETGTKTVEVIDYINKPDVEFQARPITYYSADTLHTLGLMRFTLDTVVKVFRSNKWVHDTVSLEYNADSNILDFNISAEVDTTFYKETTITNTVVEPTSLEDKAFYIAIGLFGGILIAILLRRVV
jgi:hypothetical protein